MAGPPSARPEPSLRRQVGVSSIWAMVTRLSLQFIAILSTIIMARLLGPDKIGLFEKAFVVVSILDMMSTLGIETALVQRQKVERKHYDTAWTLNICRGVLTALVVLACLPFVPGWLNNADVVPFLAVLALMPLLRGFENIGVVDFRRNLTFDKEFKWMFLRRLAAFGTAVVIALVWHSAWALVWGTIAGSLVSLVLSYVMSPYRPRLSLAAFSDLFHFSKWMFMMETANAFNVQAGRLILASSVSEAQMAFYSKATDIGNMPSTEISMPIVRALLPGLVKSDSEPVQRTNLLLTYLSLAICIGMPGGVGLALVADSLVPLAFGQAWLPMVPLLQLIGIAGVFTIVGSNASAIMISSGRIAMLAKINISLTVLKIIMLVIGLQLGGIIGVAAAVVVSAMMITATHLVVQNHLGLMPAGQFFARIWRLLLGVAAMIGVVHFGAHWLPWTTMTYAVHLLGDITLGASVYAATIVGLWFLTGKPDGPETIILSRFVKPAASGRPVLDQTGPR